MAMRVVTCGWGYFEGAANRPNVRNKRKRSHRHLQGFGPEHLERWEMGKTVGVAGLGARPWSSDVDKLSLRRLLIVRVEKASRQFGV